MYRGIPIIPISVAKHRLWVLGEAVLTCTHNQYFKHKFQKYKTISKDFFTAKNSLHFKLYSESQCISKHDKIDIFIDMKFHYQISLISKVTSD